METLLVWVLLGENWQNFRLLEQNFVCLMYMKRLHAIRDENGSLSKSLNADRGNLGGT